MEGIESLIDLESLAIMFHKKSLFICLKYKIIPQADGMEASMIKPLINLVLVSV